MTLDTLTGPTHLLLVPKGDLIGQNMGPQFLETLERESSKTRINCLVDLSGVRYIDSSGLGVLITMLHRVEEKGGKLIVFSAGDQVRKLLKITKLDTVLQVKDSQAEAEAALA